MIVTNQEALNKRISSEVNRAYSLCQDAASNGRQYIYFTTDRDIQRDVRDTLESQYNVYVPMIISRYSASRYDIEHSSETTEMKLSW